MTRKQSSRLHFDRLIDELETLLLEASDEELVADEASAGKTPDLEALRIRYALARIHHSGDGQAEDNDNPLESKSPNGDIQHNAELKLEAPALRGLINSIGLKS